MMSIRPAQTMSSSAKPSKVKPPVTRLKFVSSIEQCLALLLIVSLLSLLAGCSNRPPLAQMPAPPANLAADCPQLGPLPVPLLDPERLVWELQLLNAYADCAARHRLTVEAWLAARDRLEGN